MFGLKVPTKIITLLKQQHFGCLSELHQYQLQQKILFFPFFIKHPTLRIYFLFFSHRLKRTVLTAQPQSYLLRTGTVQETPNHPALVVTLCLNTEILMFLTTKFVMP